MRVFSSGVCGLSTRAAIHEDRKVNFGCAGKTAFILWTRSIVRGALAAAILAAAGAAAFGADGDDEAGAPPGEVAAESYLDVQRTLPLSGAGGTLAPIAPPPFQAPLAAPPPSNSLEVYGAQAETAWRSSRLFVESLMNCPVTNGVKVFDRDGRCYWAQIRGGSFEWDQTGRNAGGGENVWGGAWGLQGALDRYWRFGAAFSAERSEIKMDDGASSEGDRIQAGAVLKGSFDQTALEAGLFAGRALYDVNRMTSLTGAAQSAYGRSDVALAGGALRMSHAFKLPNGYLKPLIEVSATYLSYGDLKETGAFPGWLDVEGADKWVFSVAPAFEAGTLVWINPDTLARPFARVGVTIANDASFGVSSRFHEASGLSAQLAVSPGYDDVYGRITLGVDIFRSDTGMNFSFAYDGQFGEHTIYSVGSAKLRIAF